MITDKNFADWHDDVLGFGYGSGEEYWIPALHKFLTELIADDRSYDHVAIETAFGPLAGWLLINTLLSADICDYGTSSRHGWLNEKGELLQEYVIAHSVDDLMELAASIREDVCMRSWCNCTMTEKPCNPLFL